MVLHRRQVDCRHQLRELLVRTAAGQGAYVAEESGQKKGVLGRLFLLAGCHLSSIRKIIEIKGIC